MHEGSSVEDAITKSAVPMLVKPKPKARVLLQKAIHRTSQGRHTIQTQSDGAEGDMSMSERPSDD